MPRKRLSFPRGRPILSPKDCWLLNDFQRTQNSTDLRTLWDRTQSSLGWIWYPHAYRLARRWERTRSYLSRDDRPCVSILRSSTILVLKIISRTEGWHSRRNIRRPSDRWRPSKTHRFVVSQFFWKPRLHFAYRFLSAVGKGVFTMGITNFAFFPLSDVSRRAKEIRDAGIAASRKKIKSGEYPIGVATSLEIQASKLSRPALDCEITTIPGFFSGPSTNDKFYIKYLGYSSVFRYSCRKEEKLHDLFYEQSSSL